MGVVTYNRIAYFSHLIETWDKTRNKNHTYTLIIADDGSKDGTREYIDGLKFDNVDIKVSLNERCGVHHQINQILRLSQSIKFDIGFMSEDDMYFSKSGWDDLYLKAKQKSGHDHLCFFDEEWARSHGRPQACKPEPYASEGRLLQSKVNTFWNAFGCFWTFTPKVIEKVGFFDLKNMGLWGNGHTDYSARCCRAGFNDRMIFCDAYESENYIKMIDKNYVPSLKGEEINFASVYGMPDGGHKGKTIDDKKRIYIEYNELPYNMHGKPK